MVHVKKRSRKQKHSIALYLDYRIAGKKVQEATGLHIYPGNYEQTKQLIKDINIRFELLRNEKEKQLLNVYYFIYFHFVYSPNAPCFSFPPFHSLVPNYT